MTVEVLVKGEEVTESLLEYTKSGGNLHLIARWANRKVGAMADLEGNNELRFLEYNYTPAKDGKDEDLRPAFKEGDELECPIVASGIIVYWLRWHRQKRVKDIFEEYYAMCKQQYIKDREYDLDALEKDFEKDFALSAHLNYEIELMNASKCIYPYFRNEDVDTIKKLSDKYLKFIRDKYLYQYPYKYTEGREKQEAFLKVFENAATLCMKWVLEEYDNLFMNVSIKEIHMSLNPQKYHTQHNVTEPRLIRWEYADFDFGDIYNKDSEIIEEIKNNLNNCTSYEGRISYITKILSSFSEFAKPFYPNQLIELKKNEIEMDKRLLAKIEEESKESDAESGEKTGLEVIGFNEKEIEFYQDRAEMLKGICIHNSKQSNIGNYSIEQILYFFWKIMLQFFKKLGALLLSTYKIDLMQIQKKCGVYLSDTDSPISYVDNNYVPNFSYALQLLTEIRKDNNKSIESGLIIEGTIKKEKRGRRKRGKKKVCFTEATFTCLKDDNYKEQRLQFFVDSLWKNFIDKSTPKNRIRNLFKGTKLDKKQLIVWKGTKGELVFFSRQIKEHMICPTNEDFWNIMASHFEVKTEYKNGRTKCVPITADSLQHHTEPPKLAMIKKIDVIVSYLSLDYEEMLNRVNDKQDSEEDKERENDNSESDFVNQMRNEDKNYKKTRK